MDACPVRVSGPSGHAVSQWLRLSLRRLRTDDTLRTFTNGRGASNPLTRSELVFRDYWWAEPLAITAG